MAVSVWSFILIAFFVRSVLRDSQRYDLLLERQRKQQQDKEAANPSLEAAVEPARLAEEVQQQLGGNAEVGVEIHPSPRVTEGARQGRSPRPKVGAKGRKTLAGIDHNYIRENRLPEIFKVSSHCCLLGCVHFSFRRC